MSQKLRVSDGLVCGRPAVRDEGGMRAPFRVVITDFLTGGLEPERQVLGELAEVVALGARVEDALVGQIEEADAIILYHELTLTRRTIERLTRCKLIVRGGVGVDNVDHAYARQRGIVVANVPDYGTEEVADSALALTMALVRGVHCLNSRLRASQGPWSHLQAAPIVRLRGRTFGVVGLGRIGTAAALRAKALGMEVLFYDPYKPDGYDKALGIRRAATLEELLSRSLVVSLHCPLTDETFHAIDAAAVARMPRGSYLVNTARGGIVDVVALPEALESGHLAGAGIDVLEREPPADDDPLIAAWRDPTHAAHHRLIINPHAAFYSEEGLMEIRVRSAEACRRALAGLPLGNVVN
ncbi:MAG: C-terminal binding protein [Pirellulales bacterium]